MKATRRLAQVAVVALLQLRPSLAAPHVSLAAHSLRTHQTVHPVLADHESGAPLPLAPAGHHTRVPGTRLEHVRHARFTLHAYGRDFDMVLERSDDLVGGRFVHVSTAGARNRTTISRREDVDHCYYHGVLLDEPGSQVVVHTCGDGIESSIRTEIGEHFITMPASRVAELVHSTARRAAQDREVVGGLPQVHIVRSIPAV